MTVSLRQGGSFDAAYYGCRNKKREATNTDNILDSQRNSKA